MGERNSMSNPWNLQDPWLAAGERYLYAQQPVSSEEQSFQVEHWMPC